MKKVSYLILLFACLFMLGACNKEDNEEFEESIYYTKATINGKEWKAHTKLAYINSNVLSIVATTSKNEQLVILLNSYQPGAKVTLGDGSDLNLMSYSENAGSSPAYTSTYNASSGGTVEIISNDGRVIEGTFTATLVNVNGTAKVENGLFKVTL